MDYSRLGSWPVLIRPWTLRAREKHGAGDELDGAEGLGCQGTGAVVRKLLRVEWRGQMGELKDGVWEVTASIPPSPSVREARPGSQRQLLAQKNLLVTKGCSEESPLSVMSWESGWAQEGH